MISLTKAVVIHLCLGGLLIMQVSESRLRHNNAFYNCTKCPPGWGAMTTCSRTSDTWCTPCELGYYSPHHSYQAPCWPCSRCGQGLYVARVCNLTADTVCDSCDRLFTIDYDRFNTECIV